MRFVNLTLSEVAELQKNLLHVDHEEVRRKSLCLLLSNDGKSINELAGIFSVSRQTITNWFNKWARSGVSGLLVRTKGHSETKPETTPMVEDDQLEGSLPHARRMQPQVSHPKFEVRSFILSQY